MRLHLRDENDTTFAIVSVDHTGMYEEALTRTLVKHLTGLWLEPQDGVADVLIDSIAVFDRDLDFIGAYDKNGERK